MRQLKPYHRPLQNFWKIVNFFLPKKSFISRCVYFRRVKRVEKEDRLVKRLPRYDAVFSTDLSNVQILFLGSSHIFLSHQTSAFKKIRGWNAGFSSGDARMALATYKALRQKLPQRCVVVYGDDFWTGAFLTENSCHFYEPLLLHLYAGYTYARSPMLLKRHENFIRAIQRKWAYKISIEKKAFVINRGGNYKDDAWTCDVKKRALSQIAFINCEQTEIPILMKLRQIIEADGRKIVFLRMPVREDYLEVIRQLGVDIWSPTDSVRKGCAVIDWFEKKIPPQYWRDCDHLNLAGRKWITPELETELLRVCGDWI